VNVVYFPSYLGKGERYLSQTILEVNSSKKGYLYTNKVQIGSFADGESWLANRNLREGRS